MKTEDEIDMDQEFGEGEGRCDGEEVLVVMNSGTIDLIVAADAVDYWTAYTLDDDTLDKHEMSWTCDDDDRVIGIFCPECATVRYFRDAHFNEDVWNTGTQSYLVCENCKVIVFITPEAREKFGIPEPE